MSNYANAPNSFVDEYEILRYGLFDSTSTFLAESGVTEAQVQHRQFASEQAAQLKLFHDNIIRFGGYEPLMWKWIQFIRFF